MGILNFYIYVYWKKEKELIEEHSKIDEMDLTLSNMIFLICLGLFTGMACVCLGVGAGTITNPILIGFLDFYSPSVNHY